MDMDYMADIDINENALDVEWCDQARRFMRYSEECAKARIAMDRAKEAVDIVKAETASAVRADPEAYGLVKVTEAGVSAAVDVCAKVIGAQDAYHSAHYDFEIMLSAVRAFDHRKAALENLVRLAGQGYFATPAIPRNLGEERTALRAAEHRDVTERIKERRAGRRGGA